MKTNDQELILDYLHGRESVDVARLNSLLRDDAEARAFLRQASAADVQLRELALVQAENEVQATDVHLLSGSIFHRLFVRNASSDTGMGDGHLANLASSVRQPPFLKWLSWRPLTAAAAGLVIGAFSATAVWAIAAVKSPPAPSVPLADAGFEAGASIPSGSVPQQLNQWSGDPCAIVEALGRVHPREGRHMLKFLAASTTGDFADSKNMASDLWQVIVLPGSGARTVRIRAWFNADTDKQARFHIAAVAGDDASGSAKDLWEQRYSESEPLAFARAMISVDHDPVTWEAGELTLQAPPQARVLVISIAAYRLPVALANEWFPAQFVDDVNVSVSEEVLP
jgi:hypothetical protein